MLLFRCNLENNKCHEVDCFCIQLVLFSFSSLCWEMPLELKMETTKKHNHQSHLWDFLFLKQTYAADFGEKLPFGFKPQSISPECIWLVVICQRLILIFKVSLHKYFSFWIIHSFFSPCLINLTLAVGLGSIPGAFQPEPNDSSKGGRLCSTRMVHGRSCFC